MDENWNRWLFASITQHFDAGKGDLPILHIQGTQRKFDDLVERGEFRWSAPDWEEFTKGHYRTDFHISILLTRPLDGDTHRMQRLTGRFAKLSEDNISIYKYGDDRSHLGCLQRTSKIRIYDWGQIYNDVKVVQSSVEAEYRMDF